MSIELEITQRDGKSTCDLADIYDRYCHHSSFIAEITTLVENVSLQEGATWLLKRYLENENQLNDTEVDATPATAQVPVAAGITRDAANKFRCNIQILSI